MADALASVPELPVNPSEDANNDVRAAIAELKGDPAPTPAPQTPDPAAAPAVDAQPATTERARNERGQFIKADGSVDPDQSPVKVPDADPSKVTVPTPSPAEDAPKGWSAEMKAKWPTIDPSVRAEVSRREKGMDEAGLRWSTEKRTYDEVLQPVAAMAQATGMSPIQGVQAMMRVEAGLRDPAQARSVIEGLAKAYGVDLSGNNPAPTPQPQADPVVAELKSELHSVKQRLEAEDQRQVNGTIETFAAAKDATGQPLRPHFETVKADMGQRILLAAQQQRAMTMEQAYEDACWSNPTIRAQLIAAQTAPVDAAAKAREAAEKARRGALSAHGAPNGAAIPPKVYAPADTSAEDDVRAAIAQLRH